MVRGTGPGGIITLDDIGNYESKGLQKPQPSAEKKPALRIEKKYDLYGKLKRVPFRGIRKATADRMSEAVARSALVTHMDEADVTALWELRETEKKIAEKKGIRLTFLPYIMKAAVEALKNHPYINSELDEGNEEIILKQYYNIGFAVATEEGLFAPVIKRTDEKGLYEIAKEIEQLVEKAGKRKIDLGDLKGGTFTITNIGVIGGRFFTPIMNHPETAILGVGRIGDRAVVIDNKVIIRKTMPLSLSYDHRVIDGAQAAYFTNDLKALLESPKKLK